MIVQVRHVSIYLFSVFVCSISLFCYGFFPLSFSPSTKSTPSDLPGSMDSLRLDPDGYKPRNSRAVLMVIDALRTDFVAQRDNMRFLNELLANGSACQYQLQVHPPTVTMPRIKAITSGAIPSFLDVILNLGSPEMKLDTFLYQMKQKQRRGENVDSLYVNDFYEGDKNITKKMRLEFGNYDWKMMILHFLGLDHIGHVEGPFSDKIPGKLQEMDDVIKEIYGAMIKWNEKYYTKPLLVITGDHGMRDSGGHGGSTYPETHVPLLVVGNSCRKSDELFLQIDLAPTFATLMGVVIPHSSIGSLIDPMFNDVPSVDRVYAAHYNTRRLIEKAQEFYKDNLKEQDFYVQYKEAKLLHAMFLEHRDDLVILDKVLSKYAAISKHLSRLLIKNYIRYDMLSIVIGIALSVMTTILAVLLMIIPHTSEQVEIKPKLFIWMTIAAIALLAKIFLKKYSITESSLLQSTYFNHILLVSLSSLTTIHYSLLAGLLPLLSRTNWLKQTRGLPSYLLLFGSCFHTLSLAASSFIEEEHQTYYYLTNTLFLLLTLTEIRIMNATIAQVDQAAKSSNEVLLEHCRRERDEFCISAVLFFAGHIVLRRFNQTGDKWQHLPDIGDWLGRDGNRVWLSVVLAVGLCYLLVAVARFSGFLTIVLSATSCLLVYYYRLMTGVVGLFGVAPSKTNSCLTIFWINLLEIFFIAFLPKLYRAVLAKPAPKSSQLLASLICIVALLSALLHKPHNVVLLAALFSSSRYLVARIDHIAESKAENALLKCVAHVWLGKLFYFYQGNSNSLATIDLNAGYVGLASFDFTRVGLFLTLNTFNGQILSFLLLVYHNMRGCVSDSVDKTSHVEQSKTLVSQTMLKVLSLVVIGPMTFYVIVVALMRNHIFVWTVFSPKIIYDCFYMGLTGVQIAIVYFTF
ncbi:hypothetical protein pipiens_018814 [Culex pipiens pipiens]|uniref:GPI ethanolamine phosphate transferase 2 C-terminal domain-containing protein n=1 Tax=Culex pipiens pipiens TaxID=38569 RepID=A0ABD1DZP2_CULPP